VNESFWLTTLPLKAFLYIKTLPSPQKLKAVRGRKAPAIIPGVDHFSARLALMALHRSAPRIRRGNTNISFDGKLI
jgi:hypothetical protein